MDGGETGREEKPGFDKIAWSNFEHGHDFYGRGPAGAVHKEVHRNPSFRISISILVTAPLHMNAYRHI